MTNRIRVAVCDDHALFRTGLRMILSNQPDLEHVGEAASGEEAVALAREARPDVLLMDVRMPGVDGIEATARIVAELGDEAPRVLVLTTFDLDEAVARAVRAGASGFVLKAAEPDLLATAIRTLHAGGRLFAADAAVDILARYAPEHDAGGGAEARPPVEFERLSEREREIFRLVAAGLSNQEIAEREFVSPGTVKTHVSSILAKLGARDRIQLVVYAYEHGLAGG